MIRPRAVVFNNHLWELGGGERSTLAYTLALQSIGYDAEVVSIRDAPAPAALAAHFGQEFASVPIRVRSAEAFDRELRSGVFDVFVNHTFMSYLPNMAPIGIYVQMFPMHVLHPARQARQLRALATYHLVLSVSEFTERHTKERWPRLPCRMAVLHPPIGAAAVERAGQSVDAPSRKLRQFVHVGRFNPVGHNKNQLVLIESFIQARSVQAELRDWRLVVAGTLGKSGAAQKYFADCEALAMDAGDSVSCRANLSAEELTRLLAQSFAYVHATGAFLPPGESPELCEHFGLSILEALAHGCLAMAYGRGGIWEVVGGLPGILKYSTPDELLQGWLRLASMYGSGEVERLERESAAVALTQNHGRFARRLQLLIGETTRTLSVIGGSTRGRG